MKNRFEINELEYRSAMDGLSFSTEAKAQMAENLINAGERETVKPKRRAFGRRAVVFAAVFVMVCTLAIGVSAAASPEFREFILETFVLGENKYRDYKVDVEVSRCDYEPGYENGSYAIRVTAPVKVVLPSGVSKRLCVDLDAKDVAEILHTDVDNIPFDSELFQKVFEYELDSYMENAAHLESVGDEEYSCSEVFYTRESIGRALEYNGDPEKLWEWYEAK